METFFQASLTYRCKNWPQLKRSHFPRLTIPSTFCCWKWCGFEKQKQDYKISCVIQNRELRIDKNSTMKFIWIVFLLGHYAKFNPSHSTAVPKMAWENDHILASQVSNTFQRFKLSIPKYLPKFKSIKLLWQQCFCILQNSDCIYFHREQRRLHFLNQRYCKSQSNKKT